MGFWGFGVMALEDIGDHQLLHGGAALLRHVEPVPYGHVVEVFDAQHILREGLAAHLGA